MVHILSLWVVIVKYYESLKEIACNVSIECVSDDYLEEGLTIPWSFIELMMEKWLQTIDKTLIHLKY